MTDASPPNPAPSITPDAISPRAFTLAWAILAFAFALTRLIAYRQIGASPFDRVVLMDARAYMEIGTAVSSGQWLYKTAFFLGPGYPYLLGLWFMATDVSVAAARALNVLLSACCLAILGWTALRHLGRLASLAAGTLWTFSYSAIFQEQLVLMEVASCAFLAAALHAALETLRASTPRALLIGALSTGLLFGVCALFRMNYWICVPLLVVALVFAKSLPLARPVRILAASIVLLASALPAIPTSIHNWRVEQRFIPIASNFGLNFYIGNNANALGVYDAPPSVLEEDRGAPVAERSLGRGALDSNEISSYWFREGIAYLKGDPQGAARLYLRKLLLLVCRVDFPQIYHAPVMEDYFRILKAPLLGFGAIFPFFILGAVLLWRNGAPAPQFLAASALTMFATLIPFFVTDRYRFSFFPALILCAAGGVAIVARSAADGGIRALRVPIATFALAALACWPPWIVLDPAFSRLLVVNRDESGEMRATMYLEVGEPDIAERILLEADPSTLGPNGWFQLAKITHEFRGDACRAVDYYRNAARLRPQEAMIWLGLGLSLRQCGRSEEAIEAFTRAYKADPWMPPEGALQLAELHLQAGRTELAKRLVAGLARQHPNHPGTRALHRALERIPDSPAGS